MSEPLIGQWWTKKDGTVGRPPDTPLHEVLRWVVHQLHRGNSRIELDSDEQATTLIVGRHAATECLFDEWVQHDRHRNLALMLASLFAEVREGGANTEHAELSEELRFTADENGLANTDLHYAFELIDILARIRARTLELVTLPIGSKASPELIRLIKEATRCYLFGLHGACAALCRAVVERCLSERVPPGALVAERQRTAKGDFECLISVAGRIGLLDPDLVSMAHTIRTRGNDVLHGGRGTQADAFILLSDTRLVVDRAFAK